jgi:NAD(P)-dependent dehydrogenase (short-subunit alcohol dehydrogenase family)
VQRKGNVEELTAEDWATSWAVIVRSHSVLAAAAIPALRKSGGGSMLLTASNSGLLAESQ